MLMRKGSERSLSQAALVAVLLATAGNSLLYVCYYALGIIPWSMLSPGRGVSITPGLVFLVSLGGALGGALLYSVIRHVADNPHRTYRIVAGGLMIISFAAPFMIETFTRGLSLALDLMHVVVFAATVWAFTVWLPHRNVRATA